MDTESNAAKTQDLEQANLGNGVETVDIPTDKQTVDQQPMETDEKPKQMEQLQESQEPPLELEMREEITSPNPGLQANAEQIGNENEEKPNAETTPEDIKKIMLTQSQLKQMISRCDSATLRITVQDCYVRVSISRLPQAYVDRVFIDQIVDVLEPQSHQHLWLDRRFRLRNLGDFKLEEIVDQKIQQDYEIRSWFDYLEAKNETLPTPEFISQKDAAINAALQLPEENANGELPKVLIKRSDLGKIVVNPQTLRNLVKLDFERFRSVVTGSFVCMMAIRRDKPKDCQYHIVRVKDCIQGPRQYKIRRTAITNYQLVLPFYGNYKVNWFKAFTAVTDEGFRQWIEDMKAWNEPIPTPDEIQEKATQLQLALGEADKIPSLVEIERQQREQEELAKRAKLPIQSAKELEGCVLTQQQLQKLITLSSNQTGVDHLNGQQLLSQTLTGCFVRLNAGGGMGKDFELDQIMSVEVNEEKKDKMLLELKYAGTISLTALSYLVSTFKLNEAEFKEWAKKNEKELPILEFVQEKQREIKETIKLLGGEEEKEEKVEEKPARISTSGTDEEGVTKTAKPEEMGTEKGAAASSSAANVKVGVEERPRKEWMSVPTKDGQLTMNEFRRILVSMKKIVDIMFCDKETLVKVMRGFYARFSAKRPDKPPKQQYYTVEITGVSWGGEPYKIRNNIMTDIRLHCKRLGQQPVSNIFRAQGDNFNEEAFALFVEDMKKWKFELPTLAHIERKSREFAEATAGTPKITRQYNFSRDKNARPEEMMAFIGGKQQKVTPQMQSPNVAAFDQLQQMIQRQVVSSVRPTPGMPSQGQQGWLQSPYAQSGSQQLPFSPNWQQQADAFISTASLSLGNKRPMSDADMGRESWRMQQQAQQDPRRLREEPVFSTDYRSMSGNRVSDPNYRVGYEPEQFLGGSGPRPLGMGGMAPPFGSPSFGSSPMQQHYNAYIPSAKRSRQSPQPPPVERFY